MIEITGNMWDIECEARCITTNGTLNTAGELVMGKGNALEAKQRYPFLPRALGDLVAEHGNQVYFLETAGWKYLISFPVKHNWWEKADLDLIQDSAESLMLFVDTHDLQNVLLPRPGTGAGGLRWNAVKLRLSKILDDRVRVITNG